MRRALVMVIVLGLAAVTIPAAFAYFSEVGTFRYTITAAHDFGGDDDGDQEEKVWVCKVVGHPEDPRLKEGKNPIRVGVDSADARDGFSDEHPSFIVDGHMECEWQPEDENPAESETNGAAHEEQPEATIPPDEVEAPPPNGSDEDSVEVSEPEEANEAPPDDGMEESEREEGDGRPGPSGEDEVEEPEPPNEGDA